MMDMVAAKIEAKVGRSQNSISREVRRIATPFTRNGWLTPSQLCAVLQMWLVGVPTAKLESFCNEFVAKQPDAKLSVGRLAAEIIGAPPLPTKRIVPTAQKKEAELGRRLALARVFGFSGNALECHENESLVYAAAGGSVIVVERFLSKQRERSFRCFGGHSAAARITAVSVKNYLVASGDNTGNIKLWNIENTSTKAKGLGTGLFKNVDVLALNSSSEVLLVAGHRTGNRDDEDTGVVVCFFDCKSSQLLAEDEASVTCGGGIVRAAAASDDFSFVTVGDGHVYFWQIDRDFLVKVAPGRFHTATATSSYGAVTVLERDDQRAAQVILVGGDDGRIYVFRDGACLTSFLAHSGPVSALFSDRVTIASGGKDGKVKSWSSELKTVKSEWSLGTSVAALCRRKDSICAATSRGSIVSCEQSSRVIRLGGGHLDTARAVAAHPIDPEVFATTGDDRRLIVWTVWGERRETAKLEAAGSALAYDERPADAFGIIVVEALMVGCVNGAILSFDPIDLSVQRRYKANAAITALRLCEAGLLVAVADGDIKLYQEGSLSCTLKGHLAPVQHMDISGGDNDDEDIMALRSHDAMHQTLYWVLDADDSRRLSNHEEVKSLRWRTWTEGGKSRTRDGKLFALADPLRLADKPSARTSWGKAGGGEPLSFDVAALVFLADDRHLVAIRRDDRSILIWKVVNNDDAS